LKIAGLVVEEEEVVRGGVVVEEEEDAVEGRLEGGRAGVTARLLVLLGPALAGSMRPMMLSMKPVDPTRVSRERTRQTIGFSAPQRA